MIKDLVLATASLLINVTPKQSTVEILANFFSATIFFYIVTKVSQERWSRLMVVLAVPVVLSQFWIVSTISNFSKINLFFAFLIYIGYGLLTAISFLVIPLLMVVFRPLGAFAFPVAWCVWELIPFKLFPWSGGYLFWSSNYIPILYGYVGPVGISFILLSLISLSRSVPARSLIFLLTVCLFELVTQKLSLTSHEPDQIKVSRFLLVQPNHELELKHNPKRINDVVLDLVKLIRSESGEFDYVVLPESAVYYFSSVRDGSVFLDPILAHLTVNKPMIAGVLTFDQGRYYNSLAFIDSDGYIRGVYDKVQLMPFGEYLPFRFLTQLILPFHPIEDFTPGYDVKVVELSGLKFSGMICYEDLFPSIARRGFIGGAQVLVVVSNDLWFGRHMAPYLHDRFAGFRAVETGLPLIRVSNSGYTSVYSPLGYRSALLPPNKKLVQVVDVHVRNNPQKDLTLRQVASLFEAALMAFTAVFVFLYFGKILRFRT
ncbi:MAG: apolipoprotein N-acyltransferase [Thermoplasmatales archaeon]